MGFWGTFVLARSADQLTSSEAVLGFGYQHENLYDAGGGWQLLETRGMLPPIGLDQAGEQFVTATAAAVLAVRVYNSDCLIGDARTPEGWAVSFHLPGPAADCPHQHSSPPASPAAGAIADGLVHWAKSAGLTPARQQLRTLVAEVAGHGFVDGFHEVPLALLSPLGLDGTGEAYPVVIDVEEPPYCAVVGFHGIARLAWIRKVVRDRGQPPGGRAEPEASWEAAAIRLEAELWAGRFRAGTDTAALRRRAEDLCAAYQAADDGPLPRWRT